METSQLMVKQLHDAIEQSKEKEMLLDFEQKENQNKANKIEIKQCQQEQKLYAGFIEKIHKMEINHLNQLGLL